MLPSLKNCRRAVTLVELMVSLAIVAVLSTAVATLLMGAGNTHQYVNTETDAMSQVETAYRRIMHNVRTASAMTAPVDNTLHVPGTLTVKTQSDPNYGNVPATVTYSVDLNNNLIEQDTRYVDGSGNPIKSILVSNVSVFSIQRTGTGPTQISVTITSGTSPAVTRTAIITCRNI